MCLGEQFLLILFLIKATFSLLSEFFMFKTTANPDSALYVFIVAPGHNNLKINELDRLSQQLQQNDNINYYSDLSYYYKSNIGIEMRGHSSQDLFPKKQYGLETRNADGDNLSISLFDMPAVKDWILYAPFSDKLLMRNLIAVD